MREIVGTSLIISGLLISLFPGMPAHAVDGNGGSGKLHRAKLPRAAQDRDFHHAGEDERLSEARVELGRALFFDKILSGNENISCATCHHSLTGTGDGLALPVGEGGVGLGVNRDAGSGADAIHERVPRNAPPLFNLGAREFERLFHDGRVAVDVSQPSGFRSPAGADLPPGLENVLAVQALFPVTSATEMAGQPGENRQADLAAAGDLPALWDHLARKLAAIDGYVELFEAAFPDEVSGPGDLTFVQAANAIAAFESQVWRFTDSPFDRFVRGERDALSGSARRGMRLFYGKADCGRCHSGLFQTDHEFHAIAMPQIGGGKGDGFDGREDFGRERVSGDSQDRFRFRTPTLRNVAQTGPWGHAGAYDSLEAVVKHHLDPVGSLMRYDRDQAVRPAREDLDALDFVVMNDPARVRAIAAANELGKQRLSRREIDDLIDFLHALGDPAALDMRSDLPKSVPSGLPLAD